MVFLTIPNISNPKPWRVVHYLQLLPSGTEGVQLSVAHLSDLWLKPRLCGTKQEVRSTGLFLWSTRSGYTNDYLPIYRKGTVLLPYNRQTIIVWKRMLWWSLNTSLTVAPKFKCHNLPTLMSRHNFFCGRLKKNNILKTVFDHTMSPSW